MLRRFLSIVRGSHPVDSSSLPIADPFSELPHPWNLELFTAFKPFYSPEIQLGSYQAHPDLAERLYELEPRGKVIRANAYGFPVIANSQGLVFAWARGRWTVNVKLAEQHHKDARKHRGKPNTEYGKDWIEFPAWGAPPGPQPDPEPSVREKNRTEWSEALRRWMQVSYDESLQYREHDPAH